MSHDDDELFERLPDLVGMHPAGEDEAELREAIEASPRLRARLTTLQRLHARLRATDRAKEPSAALAARVLSIPGLTPKGSLPSPNRRGWVAIGAVAAAAGVAALLVVTSVRDTPATFEPAGEPTALIATSGEQTAITVQLGEAADGNQQVRLVATGLSSDGRVYELWLEGPSGARKVGEFAPDKNGECSLLFPAPPDEWAAATVTHANQSPGTGTIASATI